MFGGSPPISSNALALSMLGDAKVCPRIAAIVEMSTTASSGVVKVQQHRIIKPGMALNGCTGTNVNSHVGSNPTALLWARGSNGLGASVLTMLM